MFLFSELVSAFLKFTSNFQRFEKKGHLHSSCIFETTGGERRG